MKQQVSHFLRTYPMTLTLVIGIWIVCLIPIPETPLSDVALMDKWTHIALYFVLTSCIYWEDLKSRRPLTSKRLFIIAFLTPLLMGGLIEIVQATCTHGNRSGDWYDFLANSTGVILAQPIGILLVRYFSSRNKDDWACICCKTEHRQSPPFQ